MNPSAKQLRNIHYLKTTTIIKNCEKKWIVFSLPSLATAVIFVFCVLINNKSRSEFEKKFKSCFLESQRAMKCSMKGFNSPKRARPRNKTCLEKLNSEGLNLTLVDLSFFEVSQKIYNMKNNYLHDQCLVLLSFPLARVLQSKILFSVHRL